MQVNDIAGFERLSCDHRSRLFAGAARIVNFTLRPCWLIGETGLFLLHRH